MEDRALPEAMTVGRPPTKLLIDAAQQSPRTPGRCEESAATPERLDERTLQDSLAVRPLYADQQLGGNDGAQREAWEIPTMKLLQLSADGWHALTAL